MDDAVPAPRRACWIDARRLGLSVDLGEQIGAILDDLQASVIAVEHEGGMPGRRREASFVPRHIQSLVGEVGCGADRTQPKLPEGPQVSPEPYRRAGQADSVGLSVRDEPKQTGFAVEASCGCQGVPQGGHVVGLCKITVPIFWSHSGTSTAVGRGCPTFLRCCLPVVKRTIIAIGERRCRVGALAPTDPPRASHDWVRALCDGEGHRLAAHTPRGSSWATAGGRLSNLIGTGHALVGTVAVPDCLRITPGGSEIVPRLYHERFQCHPMTGNDNQRQRGGAGEGQDTQPVADQWSKP